MTKYRIMCSHNDVNNDNQLNIELYMFTKLCQKW